MAPLDMAPFTPLHECEFVSDVLSDGACIIRQYIVSNDLIDIIQSKLYQLGTNQQQV